MMRRLILTATAAAMLVLPSAALADIGSGSVVGEHPATTPTAGVPETGHPDLAPLRTCRRAVHNPNLSQDQRAAVADACAQLRSDLHAATSRLAAALNSARDEVRPEIQAAITACGNGQFDSDSCRQARAAAEQAKRQAIEDVVAAHRQFLRDVHSAIESFKSSLQSLRNGG
jgi:hypothetical protein